MSMEKFFNKPKKKQNAMELFFADLDPLLKKNGLKKLLEGCLKFEGLVLNEAQGCAFASQYAGEWDEGYFGTEGIKFFARYPLLEKDEEIEEVYSLREFYDMLESYSKYHLEKYPEDTEMVGEKLREIKEAFWLD